MPKKDKPGRKKKVPVNKGTVKWWLATHGNRDKSDLKTDGDGLYILTYSDGKLIDKLYLPDNLI